MTFPLCGVNVEWRSPYAETLRNDIPPRLSHCGMAFPLLLFNVEWHSPYAESILSQTNQNFENLGQLTQNMQKKMEFRIPANVSFANAKCRE